MKSTVISILAMAVLFQAPAAFASGSAGGTGFYSYPATGAYSYNPGAYNYTPGAYNYTPGAYSYTQGAYSGGVKPANASAQNRANVQNAINLVNQASAQAPSPSMQAAQTNIGNAMRTIVLIRATGKPAPAKY